MSPTNRWSPSAPQGFVVGAIAIAGLFLLSCGVGMSSIAVGALGVAITALGPLLIMMTGLRGNTRDFAYGTAHVHEVSPVPESGSVGRCELELVINAKGVNAVPVRMRDPAVPVNKWPQIGAALPVMVAVRDPHHVRILWDEVPAHRVVAHHPQGESHPVDPGSPGPAEGTEQSLDESSILFDDLPIAGHADHVDLSPESDLDYDVDLDPGQEEYGQGFDDSRSTDRRRRDSAEPWRTEPGPQAPRTPPTVPRTRRPSPFPARARIGAPARAEVGEPGPAPAEDPTAFPAEPAPGEAADAGGFPADSPSRAGGGASPEANGVSVTLIVSDLARSREFYRDLLGLRELDTGSTTAVLAFGDARIALRQVANLPPIDRRLVHLNLDVPDVQEAYDRLRDRGVEFVHRPKLVQRGEQLELCSATFRDPDGHSIALTRWTVRR